MVVRPREISSSIRDKMLLFDSPVSGPPDRQKRKHSDGSSPPSTLVQAKSPLVQRRAAGSRFSRRTANRLSREEDESRIPLRKLSENTGATQRSDRLALPSDGHLQKLRSEGKDSGELSGDETDDDGVVLRSSGAARSTGGSTVALSPGAGSAERSSFLDNKSKVTGIRDVVSRMEAANSEPATSDGEARSLLNKFLGAQVMMTGMESMMAAQSGAVREAQTVGAVAAGRSTIMQGSRSERSQFRSSRAEVQQVQQESFSSERQSSKTAEAKVEKLVVGGVDISQITDQDKLHNLLEQCDNFDERRKIRGRLMTLMEETRARREQATRRRVQHQQQRDSGCVTVSEAQMINNWLSENFDSKGNENAETKSSSMSASKTTSKSVTSSTRTQLSKGKQAVSPFDKFKQLDAANPKSNVPRSDSNTSDTSGGFKLDPNLAAKAMGAKEMTLYWVQNRLRDYQNVNVQNFSTSWNDGMAFCALIHHFYPDAFDYEKLEAKNRRHNFDLAFKTAEEKAGIYPLLDTDDMVMMKKPDWKCVFTYVQAIYRRLKDGP